MKFAFIDPSIATVVVACKSCAHWSAITLSRAAAYKTKADHDERVHGVEPRRAGAAGDLHRTRNDESLGVSAEVS